MPEMDGITATAVLRERDVLVPILGLTASVDEETRRDALAAGMNEVLIKPLSIQELASTLARFRAKRRSSFSSSTEGPL